MNLRRLALVRERLAARGIRKAGPVSTFMNGWMPVVVVAWSVAAVAVLVGGIVFVVVVR